MREKSLALMFLAFHLLLLAASQTFFLAHNLMSIPSAPAQSRVASGNPRACGESFLEGNSKSKPQKKSKHLLATEPLPAWVELKGEPIEVQEFLQSVVREFQWRVGENHASEDTWSFVRYLNDWRGLRPRAEQHTLPRLWETDWRLFRPAGNHVAAQFKRHPGAGTDWRAANSL